MKQNFGNFSKSGDSGETFLQITRHPKPISFDPNRRQTSYQRKKIQRTQSRKSRRIPETLVKTQQPDRCLKHPQALLETFSTGNPCKDLDQLLSMKNQKHNPFSVDSNVQVSRRIPEKHTEKLRANSVPCGSIRSETQLLALGFCCTTKLIQGQDSATPINSGTCATIRIRKLRHSALQYSSMDWRYITETRHVHLL